MHGSDGRDGVQNPLSFNVEKEQNEGSVRGEGLYFSCSCMLWQCESLTAETVS